MAIVGLVLASAAVAAAIFRGFPYWYTPFTIGSFLFFDSLSERFGARSLIRFLADGHWRVGLLMYGAAALIALEVDVLYGRALGDAWVYPPWHGFANIAVPVFFHYPFGFLSLYATFQTVRGALEGGRQTRRTRGTRLGELFGRWYGRLAFIALVLCLAAPLINYWLNANRSASELLTVVMVVSTLAIDAVRHALTGDSMLRELVVQGRPYAAAVIITLAWAIVINEGPNAFAHEWVYQTSPFGLPLWAMLVLGWPFLLVVSAAVYEMAIASASHDLIYTG